MSASINGTTGVTYPDGSTQATAATSGLVNKIINGRMEIDQRNAGASVSIAGSQQYAVDRFGAACYTGSTGATAQQTTTAPSGFVNSLKVTIGTGQTVASGDVNYVVHKIEGLNVADLGWGAVGASSVTLSFWVRSSVTGTFGGALQNSASNRSYPFSYTINAANTFEQKTITIAGDTSGTWLATNGIGIQVFWGLGVGSTYSGTAGSWAGAQYLSATGSTGIVPTTGATFYITGVDLRKGTVAPTTYNMDWRPYGLELALCQRYYWKATADAHFPAVWSTGGSQVNVILKYPVTMRSAPSASISGTVSIYSWTVSDATSIAYSAFNGSADACALVATTSGAGSSAGGLAGVTYNTGSILLSAEL